MTIKKKFFLKAITGQSLVEIVLALALASVLIGAAVVGIVFVLRSGQSNEKFQTASALSRSFLQTLHYVSEGNWLSLYNLQKGSDVSYYLVPTSTLFQAVSGHEGVSQDVAVSNLLHHWKFDEDSSSSLLYDSLSEGRTGLFSGGVFRSSSCYASRCLSFDGVDGYAQVSSPLLDNLTAFSLSFWARMDEARSVVFLAKRDDANFSWETGLTSDGHVFGRVNALGYEALTSSTLPLQVWTHIALTFDGSNILLYLNGSLEDSYSYAGSISSFTGPVSFGRRMSSFPDYLLGLMDEVRVYNRALSLAEIRDIYNSNVFVRSFSVEDVNRDLNGKIVSSGGVQDPSTEKVTVSVEWVSKGNATTSIQVSDFLTRWKNEVFSQTDWSEESGSLDPLFEPEGQYYDVQNLDTSSGSLRIRTF
ncbi:hypothetical protein A3A21_00415 [Candidatus Jorgensenbacteria bacterium RIFCSPLOWO2_01_FULL_45_25b]|uniref:LamG-like jellyroll fold domain-containing protein n=1 Tax=Candidatus Jorgensenbacteria bacterium RIFCSPLOWO2_01_FULL_45_25b TaxID=1798471 RepID=A0A1F6BUR4_9BACT|nr:MAG: hypothetical protein A3A21_00415 [Candidatus Jorgensenbacteria bacterium RIFCSPLOWO2_01_FULL_45_25b]